MRRALISLSDKSGLEAFAKALHELDFELYSTGGTAQKIREAGLPVIDVSEYTGFPEMLGGRVKTLHPKIFAGILARQDNADDKRQMSEQGLDFFHLVCVNLYPFKEALLQDKSFPEQIEQIDIGGPSLLRAAAKNHKDVLVVTDPADYDTVLEALREDKVTDELKRALAAKVYRQTAAYDSLIADYFAKQLPAEADLPQSDLVTGAWELKDSLRYGENPQQQASVYENYLPDDTTLLGAKQLHGKALSFNNYGDASAAVQGIRQFTRPTVIALKHANPCGIGSADTIEEAWDKAFEGDPVSIFGGIIAQNRPVTKAQAEKMSEIFLEIILAPSFDEDAFAILAAKKNIRLMELPALAEPARNAGCEWRFVDGGLLIQDFDDAPIEEEEFTVVTDAKPDANEKDAYIFAMKACRLLKSNSIAVTTGEQTLGMGPGQSNRVGAAKIALEMAGEKAKGAILASDAFFPFKDTVEVAHEYGIKGIIQPGGSIRDQDSIDFCNEHGIVMIFTGRRHFRH